MKNFSLTVAIFLWITSELIAQDIFINQIGYRPHDRKDFRLKVEAQSFKILDSNGAEVYQDSISLQAEQDFGAQEDVWIGDFSSFNVEGEGYTIKLDNGQQSKTFAISSDLYNEVFKTAVRGLYVTRCTYAVRDEFVEHGVCHEHAGKFVFDIINKDNLKDPVNFTADDRDVAGGWHNGGDYRRSTISAAQAINSMLSTVESFPDKFTDYTSTLTPSEQTNGWPDIVIESKWGLDWLVNMQDGAGGMPTGLAPTVDSQSDWVTPEDDFSDYFLGIVHSANTGKAGAALAKGARVFRDYDATLANTYEERAIMAYNFLEENGAVGHSNTVLTYEFNGNWKEDFLWLALELYLTTEDPLYNDKFVSLYSEIKNDDYNGDPFPYEPASTHTMRAENLQHTLLEYCLAEGATSDAIKNEIWNAAKVDLDSLVDNWRKGYGYVLPEEFWDDRHTIGNSLHKAWTLLLAYRVSEVRGENLTDYRDAALDQINIMLGRNTLDKAFVTGIGHNPVTDPHLRLIMAGGVPPGMPVKGPTNDGSYIRNNNLDSIAAYNYKDIRFHHQVNEPDVEATGYFIALTGYLASDEGATTPIVQRPYQGTARSLPGLIEAEHYDEGGQGVSYFDTSDERQNKSFRKGDRVDVLPKSAASNGYAVGWTDENEWLEYTVDVQSGTYDIQLAYSSGAESAGDLLVSLDGDTLGVFTEIVNTTSYNTFDSIKITGVRLRQSQNSVLRLSVTNGAGFDLDAIKFIRTTVDVTGVAINNCSTDDLQVGDTYDLNNTITPTNATFQGVMWSSGNSDVATVDGNGIVTILAAGAADIVVTTNDKKKTDTCRVVVRAGSTVVVRAKGQTGEEEFELQVNGNRVGSIQRVSQAYQKFTFNAAGQGDLRIRFVNDGTVNGADKNLRVDYISVDGDIYESENQSNNTAAWNSTNRSCGGVQSEWLHCAGYIEYTSSSTESVSIFKPSEVYTKTNIYPNPVKNGILTVRLDKKSDAEIHLRDLSGKILMTQKVQDEHLIRLNTGSLSGGVYVVEVITSSGVSSSSKVYIK
jgi:endoglucanase